MLVEYMDKGNLSNYLKAMRSASPVRYTTSLLKYLEPYIFLEYMDNGDLSNDLKVMYSAF